MAEMCPGLGELTVYESLRSTPVNYPPPPFEGEGTSTTYGMARKRTPHLGVMGDRKIFWKLRAEFRKR